MSPLCYSVPGISSDIRCVLTFTCCKTTSGTHGETNHTQTGAHLSKNVAKLSTIVKNALVSQREIEDDTLWLDSKTALFWIENRGEWK